ncbi:cytidine deaminase [Photobacterium galatheae]|uniref:Cytidine deaminase n=1 Tax=Photobacterium galatheae TaxID=1654360 RepID=A0A066RQA8_9GAMM|nr:cytidine deaminase [Photobacterium galatheae]KDM91281.1 cytidine deaminase [Photobacterium galatheae]MCM0150318.1 cytidine deaminase [Photobacterium galatheae]
MRADVMDALGQLPLELSQALKPVMTAPGFDATLSKEEFEHLMAVTQLSDADLRIQLLKVAAAYSIASLSNFYVGAIARGNSGRLYFGANMEFEGTSMSQTVHAEQSAISHAWLKGETGIVDITVNYSPCGHCRQFMNELSTAQSLMVQLPERAPKALQTYLPESFGPTDLGITDLLLSDRSNGLSLDSDDALLQAACQAADKSHAPYSKNFAGVALKAKDGRVFTGMYAENAAFNPSLPPLQVAMIHMNMANYPLSDIAEAALVEQKTSLVSLLADTQNTLESFLPDIQLSYAAI